MTDGCDISSEIALRWTSLDLNDDKSTLVQVMAWYRQATSHFLSQCWPRSLPPYGVTRPQWVNLSLFLDYNLQWFSIILCNGVVLKDYKPVTEPIMAHLLPYICVTSLRWSKISLGMKTTVRATGFLHHYINHDNDVKWAPWGLKSPANRLFVQPFVQGNSK